MAERDSAKKVTAASGSGGKGPEELLFISEDIPPIPSKVVQKIEKGEYVDLVDLLLKKSGWEEPSISELSQEGIIVVTQSKQLNCQKKAIQDVATWFEAFVTFATIRNRKYPTYASDLLALVVRGARDYKGSGWLSYNFQYRWLAAACGNLGDWGIKDVSPWNETVCNLASWDTPSQPRNSDLPEDLKCVKRKGMPLQMGNSKEPRSAIKDKPWKRSVCFPFSYTSKCTREKCDLLHVCFDCGGQHPQVSCKKSETSHTLNSPLHYGV
uniref:C3H1-type domain-containing protein n=1 Tax=Amphimedon queenslandica TaxID=400682 RepID=A0A1X7V4R4_AMPQE